MHARPTVRTLALATLTLAFVTCTGSQTKDSTKTADTSASSAATTATPSTPNTGAPALKAVAANLAQAAMIKPGDKVLIAGSPRDVALLEDIAVEAMKMGGLTLITVGSEKLGRRSYDEVPAQYDGQAPTLGLAIVNTFDVQITVDNTETENAFAGVPADRMAARAKAGAPVGAAFYKRSIRSVNLGNGLYPIASLATRLGVPQTELAATFWRAASVPAETLRVAAEPIRAALANARQITLTSPNGTNLSFGVVGAKAMISDGTITADKVKQGGAAASTWLPAGEVLIPAASGTADGRVVIDKYLYNGQEIRGLALAFSKGRLTSMTALSGLEPLKAFYDAATAGKDEFSYIDIGVNPEARLPTGNGTIVWMAPGGVSVGFGNNLVWGGTNNSSFGLATPVTGATLTVDGKAIIENGAIRSP